MRKNRFAYVNVREIMQTPLEDRPDYTEVIVCDAQDKNVRLLSFYVNKHYQGVYFRGIDGTFTCAIAPNQFHLGCNVPTARMAIKRIADLMLG